MEQARLTDGSLIEAKRLARSSRAGIVECQCEHCRVRVYLAGYRGGAGKAHFRTWPGEVHIMGCRHRRTKTSAKRKQVVPVPESLVSIIDLRSNPGRRRSPDQAVDEDIWGNSPISAEQSGRQRREVAGTIWRACEIHFAQPYLKAPLSVVRVPGLARASYRSVFKPVALRLAEGHRIWFSSLAAGQKPKPTDAGLQIVLYFYHAGRSYNGRLVIKWAKWTPKQRRFIEEKLSTALQIRGRLRGSNRRDPMSPPSKHPKVYFLADEIERERLSFVVTDPKRVCIIWGTNSD